MIVDQAMIVVRVGIVALVGTMIIVVQVEAVGIETILERMKIFQVMHLIC